MMRTALLGGIIIGFFVIGWLGVFILPLFVAFYQCVELFFLKRKKLFNSSRIKKLKKSGMTDKEIEEIIALYNGEYDRSNNLSLMKKFTSPYAEANYNLYASSWTKWIDSKKIYMVQFFWTYTTTTVIALIVVFIKYLFKI